MAKGHPPAANFAVVIDPGTLMQEIDSYTMRLDEATPIARDLRDDGLQVEIMRTGFGGALLPLEGDQ